MAEGVLRQAETGFRGADEAEAVALYRDLSDKARYEETTLEERAPVMSLVAMLREKAVERASARALSFQLTGELSAKVHEQSYAELWRGVVSAANGLHALGVGRGETVALLMPNLPETVTSIFAAQALGVSATVNPLLSPDAIAAILRDSGATALITLAPFLKTDVAQKAAEALKSAPDVKLLVEVDLAPYVPGVKGLAARMMRPKVDRAHGAKVVSWSALKKRGGSKRDLAFDLETDPESVGALFHTGGTTGAPKLIPHTRRGMVSNATIIRDLVLTERDVSLVAIPLFHIYGVYVGVAGPLAAGARVHLLTPQGFRGQGVIDNFWKTVAKQRGSFVGAVPQAIAALDRKPVDADVSTLNYFFSGSAPLPVALFKRFEQNTGVRILEGYGLTEGTCVSGCNPPHGARKIGSVGLPVPYSEYRIERFDDEDRALGRCETDEIGEICFSGPNMTPATKANQIFEAADTPGVEWRRTGDLGRIDADGYLWITGRQKDIIIRGGHNLDPSELEGVLEQHPEVAFAAVVGQPDPLAGETPCAYVEMHPGATATERDLKAFAIKNIAERASRPAALIILDELPRTSLAKIFKPELRRRALERTYAATLSRAGVAAKVEAINHPTDGLVAVISADGSAPLDEAKVAEVFDGWPKPWRFADAERG